MRGPAPLINLISLCITSYCDLSFVELELEVELKSEELIIDRLRAFRIRINGAVQAGARRVTRLAPNFNQQTTIVLRRSLTKLIPLTLSGRDLSRHDS
jgi:hypothetical protein